MYKTMLLVICIVLCGTIVTAKVYDDFENGVSNWEFIGGSGDSPTFTQEPGLSGAGGYYDIWAGNDGIEFTDEIWNDPQHSLSGGNYNISMDVKFLSNGAHEVRGRSTGEYWDTNYYGLVFSNALSSNFVIEIAGPSSTFYPSYNQGNLPTGVSLYRDGVEALGKPEYLDGFEDDFSNWEVQGYATFSENVNGLNGVCGEYSIGADTGAITVNDTVWQSSVNSSDYSFKCDVKTLSQDSGVFSDIVNRLSSRWGTDTLGIRLIGGGTPSWTITILGPNNVVFDSGNLPSGVQYDYSGWNLWEIQTVESNLTVNLNNAQLWSGQVVGASSGKPALRSGWGGHVLIDNVDVKTIHTDGWNNIELKMCDRDFEVWLNHEVLWSGVGDANRSLDGRFGVRTGWTGSFIIDNVSVSDVFEAELGLADGSDDYVFAPNDTVSARLHLKNGIDGTRQVTFKLIDFNEATVWQSSANHNFVSFPVDINTSFTIPYKGAFRLDAIIEDANTVAEMALGAVYPNLENIVPDFDSKFGMSSILDDFHLDITQRMGASWLRLHDMDRATYWEHCEPQNGVWQWSDAQLNNAFNRGFHVMGQLQATPLWASNAPQAVKDAASGYTGLCWQEAWGYIPVDLNDVADYVTTVVNRYKNNIHAWEVWNEPHVIDLFWRGTAQQYVDMCRVMYNAAKAADPNCIIVGGGGINYDWVDTYNDITMKKLFDCGLLNYCDAFSVHYYPEDQQIRPSIKTIAELIHEINTLMLNYTTTPPPIWLSETNISGKSILTDPTLHNNVDVNWSDFQKTNAQPVRGTVDLLAAGVDRIFRWRLVDFSLEFQQINDYANTCLEYTKAPKASYYAYAAMIGQLEGMDYYSAVDLGSQWGVRCEVFQNANRSTAVIWYAQDDTANLTFNTAMQVYDLMGNLKGVQTSCPITYIPHYIVAENTSVSTLVSRLQNGTVTGLHVKGQNYGEFWDDFSSGTGNWNQMIGNGDAITFNALQGPSSVQAYYYANSGNRGIVVSPTAWSNANLASTSNYTVSMDVWFLSDSEHQIRVRSTDSRYDSDYCGVNVTNARRFDWTLGIVGPESGVGPTFNAASLPSGVTFNINTDGWNTFEITVYGSNLIIKLNGGILYSGSIHSSRRTSGYPAISTEWYGNFYLDNVFITVPTASTPSPANNATSVSLTPTLGWTTGTGATSHDVYFGTSQVNVTVATHASAEYKGNQTGTAYAPGTLTANTTYYWRIDEVGNEGTITGDVWSFTTETPPTFVSAGSITSGTVTITPSLPASITTGDILLLFIETSNQAVSISNQNGGTWTQVTNSPQYTGTAAGTTGVRLAAYWSRYNGTQGNPTVSDSGNHQMGRIIAIRGAVSSGNPWDVTIGGVEAVSDTSGSIPGATTTASNTLVVVAIASALPDVTGTSNFSNWTNFNLASLTERTDNTVIAGNGGGIGVATGIKATAGAYGNTTVTFGSSSYKAMMSIAIKP